MAKQEDLDPFEFDLSAPQATAPKPAAAQPVSPASGQAAEGADLGDLFGDLSLPQAPEPAKPKPKALQIDFDSLLGAGKAGRAGQKIGAAVLDTEQFMSKKDAEALERAKAAPKVSLPSSIDLEERIEGTRVVAESKRFWIWLVLIAIVPVIVAISGVYFYVQHKSSKMEQEIEELRRSEGLHRKAIEKREQELLR
ncbi:MAG: hypothetical protein ACOX6T_00690 [Myxococcales bacterium]|jgi:hypothetical protein